MKLKCCAPNFVCIEHRIMSGFVVIGLSGNFGLEDVKLQLYRTK
jgi:hypothetical protein